MRIEGIGNSDTTWHWALYGGNGKMKASSECFSQKSNCMRAIRDVAGELGWMCSDDGLRALPRIGVTGEFKSSSSGVENIGSGSKKKVVKKTAKRSRPAGGKKSK